MRNLLNYGIALLLCAGFLTSCGDDDDEVTPDGTNTPGVIDGTWHRSYVNITTYAGNGSTVGNPKEEFYSKGQVVEELLPNSVYKLTMGDSTYTGTYSKVQDSLFVTRSGKTARFHIDSLTTKRLVLSGNIKNDIGGKDSYIIKSVR